MAINSRAHCWKHLNDVQTPDRVVRAEKDRAKLHILMRLPAKYRLHHIVLVCKILSGLNVWRLNITLGRLLWHCLVDWLIDQSNFKGGSIDRLIDWLIGVYAA